MGRNFLLIVNIIFHVSIFRNIMGKEMSLFKWGKYFPIHVNIFPMPKICFKITSLSHIC